MPYPIEIIATNAKHLKYIEQAIVPLNRVQSEFTYRLGTPQMLDEAALFVQDEYTLDEVFDWMSDLHEKIKGNHPYVILIVDKFLSGKLGNLFGGHDAENGFAVFTTDSFDPRFEQFLFDIVRFCRYYLVRYTLSFIDHSIKSHPTIGCMFDAKIDKADILLSLNTGKICDPCTKRLRLKYSPEMKAGIDRLLKVVSNQMPRALVMKGGGVKGIAFAGALLELGKYFTFDTFAGTSAGAITAGLLGAGYQPSEILQILQETNFDVFRDTHLLARIGNFFKKGGAHSGDKFKKWINSLIKTKISEIEGYVKMSNLKHRTVVYATRVGDGTVRFDSAGERSDAIAAFAIRCSMSIPAFFVPVELDGIKVYDGGLGNNFPLRTFMEDNQQKLFIGLYLVSPFKEGGSVPNQLLDIVTDADERQVVNRHLDSIVKINPYPIDTKEFKLSDEKKEFLVKCGRVGALKYLSEYHKDVLIDPREVERLSAELETDRDNLIHNEYRSLFGKQ